MRKRIIVAALASTVALAGPAAAQEKGVYVSLGAGVSSVSDTDLRYYDVGGTFGGTGARDEARASVDLQKAAEFNGSIGYDFGVVRADIELAYSRNKARSLTIKSINGAAVTLSAADGQDVCDYLEVTGCQVTGNKVSFSEGSRLRRLSAFGNIWVDIPVSSAVTPYAGGGVGVTGFEMDGEGTGKFAWQLGAGVAFNVSRHVAITVDYRHREASGETFEWDAVSGFEVGRIKTNSFSAGVRFRF